MRDLIIPSIHIKDAHIREKAFVSLGLCCSIARVSPFSYLTSSVVSCVLICHPPLLETGVELG